VDDVLDVDPSNILCLMGRGYILQHSKRWPEARELFERVAELLPDDLDDGLRAREEEAWCKLQMDEAEVAQEALKDVLVTLDSLEGRNEDKARCWWRYGRSHWALGGQCSQDPWRIMFNWHYRRKH
jgi:superkiller protein 3